MCFILWQYEVGNEQGFVNTINSYGNVYTFNLIQTRQYAEMGDNSGFNRAATSDLIHVFIVMYKCIFVVVLSMNYILKLHNTDTISVK